MSAELNRILKEENLFRILNLETSASAEDIRSAYKRLVKTVHPDRFQDPGERNQAEMAFKRVGVAFNTLRDPLLRKDYERGIERTSSVPDPRPARPTAPRAPQQPGQQAPAGPAPPRPGTGPISAADAKKREQLRQEQAERHFQQGKEHERKNAFDDAIKEYQEAIRIYHDMARYHSQLGFALQKKGWVGYAQAEFKVALHFDPTDKLALKHYQPTAGSSQSKATGFKLLNLFRGDSKGLRLGDILIKLGHLNKEQLQKALKQQSDEKLLLGEILIRLNYIKPEHLAQALIHQADSLQKAGDKA
ncbi:MAG: DnaJ domain-containing protein [Candidatus Sericytochromatia bacterium]